MPHDRWFLFLCAGEIAVVLAGQVSIPAAVLLQLLVPLIIFRQSVVSGPSSSRIAFAAVFGLATVMFAVFLLSFRHTLLPLLILTAAGLLVVFIITISKYRIDRRYGGTA
jgi:glucan phosphoethanolaminetransferase (alkaline phosphatase superfamily)